MNDLAEVAGQNQGVYRIHERTGLVRPHHLIHSRTRPYSTDLVGRSPRRPFLVVPVSGQVPGVSRQAPTENVCNRRRAKP